MRVFRLLIILSYQVHPDSGLKCNQYIQLFGSNTLCIQLIEHQPYFNYRYNASSNTKIHRYDTTPKHKIKRVVFRSQFYVSLFFFFFAGEIRARRDHYASTSKTKTKNSLSFISTQRGD